MYSLHAYGGMTVDRVRVDAYAQAMRAAIKPGDVVLDIGAGAGYFSFLACKLGAKKVYAVEPADSIWVAKACARELGLEDRIECIQAFTTDIDLPERVDVIIADLRGGLSIIEGNFSSVLDARKRFLRPGGTLLPLRDSMHVALVESPVLRKWLYAPWSTEFGELATARRIIANTRHTVLPDHIKEEHIVSSSAVWSVVDYHADEEPKLAGVVELKAEREAVVDGLALWFDAEIAEGVGFSNRLRPGSVYATAFLPLEEPLAIRANESLSVAVQSSSDGNTWGWEVKGERGERKQSTLGSQIPVPRLVARLAGGFRPYRRPAERALDRVRSFCDGTRTLKEIEALIGAKNEEELYEVRRQFARLALSLQERPPGLKTRDLPGPK